jgi:hypothetical protein
MIVKEEQKRKEHQLFQGSLQLLSKCILKHLKALEGNNIETCWGISIQLQAMWLGQAVIKLQQKPRFNQKLESNSPTKCVYLSSQACFSLM